MRYSAKMRMMKSNLLLLGSLLLQMRKYKIDNILMMKMRVTKVKMQKTLTLKREMKKNKLLIGSPLLSLKGMRNLISLDMKGMTLMNLALE